MQASGGQPVASGHNPSRARGSAAAASRNKQTLLVTHTVSHTTPALSVTAGGAIFRTSGSSTAAAAAPTSAAWCCPCWIQTLPPPGCTCCPMPHPSPSLDQLPHHTRRLWDKETYTYAVCYSPAHSWNIHVGAANGPFLALTSWLLLAHLRPALQSLCYHLQTQEYTHWMSQAGGTQAQQQSAACKHSAS